MAEQNPSLQYIIQQDNDDMPDQQRRSVQQRPAPLQPRVFGLKSKTPRPAAIPQYNVQNPLPKHLQQLNVEFSMLERKKRDQAKLKQKQLDEERKLDAYNQKVAKARQRDEDLRNQKIQFFRNKQFHAQQNITEYNNYIANMGNTVKDPNIEAIEPVIKFTQDSVEMHPRQKRIDYSQPINLDGSGKPIL